MKIRTKISLTFTALTCMVLLFSFSFIYLLTAHYTENEFYNRLQEKADFTAKKYFKKDELSQKVYEEIMAKNAKSLPEAQEIVLDAHKPKQAYDSLTKSLPKDLVLTILSGHNIKFDISDRQGIGLYFPDNQGTFLVIVSAVDRIGILKQQNLLKVLLAIFLGSTLFMYLMGILYAKKVFSPVGHIIKNVKRINATNLKLRLTENEGTDELAELTRMLNQMLDRLDHSFDMQKNFISNASHELKNPLTAIIGETEITLSKPRTVDQYITSLNKIATEGERLDFLTQNLLSMAQVDFANSETNTGEVRIDEMVWKVKEYYDTTPYKNRLIFHIDDLPDNPEQLTIKGIQNLLMVGLTNLIDNACKFSGQQKVDILLKAVPHRITLTINDQGIGIPESERQNLYQPFFRASNAYSYKGSGIGLSLAHKIIRLHNGTLEMASRGTQGTRAEITFQI